LDEDYEESVKIFPNSKLSRNPNDQLTSLLSKAEV